MSAIFLTNHKIWIEDLWSWSKLVDTEIIDDILKNPDLFYYPVKN